MSTVFSIEPVALEVVDETKLHRIRRTPVHPDNLVDYKARLEHLNKMQNYFNELLILCKVPQVDTQKVDVTGGCCIRATLKQSEFLPYGVFQIVLTLKHSEIPPQFYKTGLYLIEWDIQKKMVIFKLCLGK
jgi:hypothetical protein